MEFELNSLTSFPKSFTTFKKYFSSKASKKTSEIRKLILSSFKLQEAIAMFVYYVIKSRCPSHPNTMLFQTCALLLRCFQALFRLCDTFEKIKIKTPTLQLQLANQDMYADPPFRQCQHRDAQVITEEGVPSFATSRISSNVSSTQDQRVCKAHVNSKQALSELRNMYRARAHSTQLRIFLWAL